jgi:hypothetical protein
MLIDQPGVCISGGGQLYCDAPDPFLAACEGEAEGSACTLMGEVGVCQEWGFGPYCSNDAWWGGGGEVAGGGLDGIATDACGNVYVTEFTSGRVFRWTAAGEGPEMVVKLPSWWIPNMDFGSGLGGWDETYLWVNTRETDEMYGLDIGLPGRRAAHLP